MPETSKALEDVMYETIAVHNLVVTIIMGVEVEEGAVRVARDVVEAVEMDVEEEQATDVGEGKQRINRGN